MLRRGDCPAMAGNFRLDLANCVTSAIDLMQTVKKCDAALSDGGDNLLIMKMLTHANRMACI